MAGSSLILASTSGILLAADVPFPIELTALAMVGLVLRWLIRTDSRKDQGMERRIANLEAEAKEQRHLKHEFRNRITALRGALLLARQAATDCSCGAMVPMLPFIDQLLASIEQEPK